MGIRRIIGCGQAMRRDDAAGLEAARQLSDDPPIGFEVSICTGDGADLAERLSGASEVVVLDAMRSGSPPGSIRRFSPLKEAMPVEAFAASTHALGVSQAIELSRVLGDLPEKLIVYGIEAGDVAIGEGLSENVARAVRRLVAALREGREPDA